MPLQRCPYCRKLFKPDPRIKNRQKVCSQTACQKKRKSDYQKKWCEKNPTYFRGRYPRLKEWLDAHPGYLNDYRHSNKPQEGTQRKRVAAGEEMPFLEVRALLESRIVEIEKFFRTLPCHDIQVVIEAGNPDMKLCCAQFTHG